MLSDGVLSCMSTNITPKVTLSSQKTQTVETTYYRYAENGMDVVHIQQKNGDQLDTAFQAIYNDQHLPTQITDAAGANL